MIEALVLAAGIALQAQICTPAMDMLEALKKLHNESLEVAGISDGKMVAVTTSPNGSWTILSIEPGGQSCILADGEGWGPMPVTARPKGSN